MKEPVKKKEERNIIHHRYCNHNENQLQSWISAASSNNRLGVAAHLTAPFLRFSMGCSATRAGPVSCEFHHLLLLYLFRLLFFFSSVITFFFIPPLTVAQVGAITTVDDVRVPRITRCHGRHPGLTTHALYKDTDSRRGWVKNYKFASNVIDRIAWRRRAHVGKPHVVWSQDNNQFTVELHSKVLWVCIYLRYIYL